MRSITVPSLVDILVVLELFLEIVAAHTYPLGGSFSGVTWGNEKQKRVKTYGAVGRKFKPFLP